jgi:hypothetical protein
MQILDVEAFLDSKNRGRGLPVAPLVICKVYWWTLFPASGRR